MTTLKFFINGEERPGWIVQQVYGEDALNALRIGVHSSPDRSFEITVRSRKAGANVLRAAYIEEEIPYISVSEYEETMRRWLLY